MSKTYILHCDSDNGYTNKNLFYILGFDPSLGTIIFDDEKVVLVFDARYHKTIKNYELKIKNSFKEIYGKDYEIQTILLDGKLFDKIEKYIIKNEIVLEENIPTIFYKNIKKLNPKNIDFVSNIFEKERIIKSENEIKKIKKAINIIEKVYKEIYKNKENLVGKKEIEVRRMIQKFIIDFGGTNESFPTIVAFGKNSAIPHHQTGNTIIRNGPLLIDMGAIYNGYCSDFTRTFWVGEKTSIYNEFIKVKSIVKKAHDAGVEFVRENILIDYYEDSNDKNGVTGKDLDKMVRNYIEQSGYGEYFTHSTGHGVGLQIHEQPWITSKKQDQTLEKGMVFTIEPGIYLPMNFGVRWENIVIL